METKGTIHHYLCWICKIAKIDYHKRKTWNSDSTK